MNTIESAILGVVQGLTEYLPVSSSGHLAVGAEMMGSTNAEENLAFTVLVHAATCLSSVIVFRKEIQAIFADLFKFKWNEGTRYAAMIVVADIPVIIAGLLLADQIDDLFANNLVFIGCMWLLTATLLLLTIRAVGTKKHLSFLNTFIVGIGQTFAILPGLSRAGTTIATGLLVGIDRAHIARFSFLMVIPPVLGKTILDTKDALEGQGAFTNLDFVPALTGFLAAFISGWLACRVMLNVVQKGKVHYFAFYCMAAGILAILVGSQIISW
jgi:undecaprenyl-diphosphatase